MLAETNLSESLKNAIQLTTLVCPVNVCIKLPVEELKIFIDLSEAPLAMIVPSGEKVANFTSRLCPASFRIGAPVLASQVLTILSIPVDTIWLESGLKATLRTHEACAFGITKGGLSLHLRQPFR